MNSPNDAGSSTPLLALLILLALLLSYTASSPTVALLSELRSVDQRLQRSLALLQAVGRLGAAGYDELRSQPLLLLPGKPPVGVRLERHGKEGIAATLYVEEEESAALEIFLIRPDGRER